MIAITYYYTKSKSTELTIKSRTPTSRIFITVPIAIRDLERRIH